MRGLVLGTLVSVVGACTTHGASSNIQFDFSSRMPVQAGQTHLTLYAIASGDTTSLFAITTFEVHHVVDLGSPCYIDVGDHVPHPGLHVSQYATVIEQDTGIPDPLNPPAGASANAEIEAATALQRERDIDALVGPMGILAVTSASDAVYPAVDADCSGTGLPPPTCTDEDSNQRRLAQCQQVWHDNPGLYEGTDRILTAPLAGTGFGMVDGINPVNGAPVGGAEIFSDAVLDGFDAYAVYSQADGATGTGDLLLFGTSTMPTRGVIHVHMTSPTVTGLTADVAIFPNLEDDDVHF